MPEILRLASIGLIRLESMVTTRYSLDEADMAYRALDAGTIVGRAIVTL